MKTKPNCRNFVCERVSGTVALTTHVTMGRYPNVYGSDSNWFKAANHN